MEKKNILYIMHVSWNWIKQRPHYLAEELSKEFRMTVAYPYVYNKKQLSKVPLCNNIHYIVLKRLPFERFRLIKVINIIIQMFQILKEAKKYEIIWITSPDQYFFIWPLIKHNHIIIYDCMDDHLAFDISNEMRKALEINERRLLSKCNLIFASSQSLEKELRRRYNLTGKKIYVINNGCTNISAKTKNAIYNYLDRNDLDINRNKKKIVYIGTISKWMDFDLLEYSLFLEENIEYHFFGPWETTPFKHERFFSHKPIAHEAVPAILNWSDANVMPFKITKLIKSVNPVKLYEYILSGKPVIAPLYGESEQFKEYIYLYSSAQEYCAIIKDLGSNNLIAKASLDKCIKFCERNTWEKRGYDIRGIISSIIDC